MMELREAIARAIHGRCDNGLDASWGDWLPEADAVLEVLSRKQPVAWMSPGRERLEWVKSDTVFGSHTIPLYLAPGAIQGPLRTGHLNTEAALNTLAKVTHSGEEVEGADGLGMFVDMALWHDLCEAVETLVGEDADDAPEVLRQQKPAVWMQSNHLSVFQNLLPGSSMSLARCSSAKAQGDFIPLYAAPGAQAADVQELTRALELCRFALEPYDDVKPRDWKTDRERLRAAHRLACDALAKFAPKPEER